MIRRSLQSDDPGMPCTFCGVARGCEHREICATMPPPALPREARRKGEKWKDDELATLSLLWPDPEMTATKIAEMIPGRTRDSVLGMAHRLGLRMPHGKSRST